MMSAVPARHRHSTGGPAGFVDVKCAEDPRGAIGGLAVVAPVGFKPLTNRPLTKGSCRQ
jgi:hypothetical protein